MSHRGYVLDLGQNRFEGPGKELLDDPKVSELYLGGSARIAQAGARLTGTADRGLRSPVGSYGARLSRAG